MAKKLEDTFFWKALLDVERWILFITSALSVLIIVAGVFMRYVLNLDLFGMEEIMVIVAFWLYFIGAAHGSYERSHISAEIISVYVKSEKIKAFLKVIESTITSFVVVVLTYWGWRYFIWGLTKGARSTGWKIPLVTSQSAIFFGFALMAFYSIYYLIKDIQRFRQQNKSPDVN
ncbi:MAG: TRAP transporter small permease [Pseudomonadota bacterium]